MSTGMASVSAIRPSVAPFRLQRQATLVGRSRGSDLSTDEVVEAMRGLDAYVCGVLRGLSAAHVGSAHAERECR